MGKEEKNMKKASKKDTQSLVNISYCMTGKMTNILSLSTNVKKNSRCMHRHNCKGTICEHCFAIKTVNSYDSLHRNLNANTEVLTSRHLTHAECSAIAYEIVKACIKNETNKFRFESFGDLNNEIQAKNYLNICVAINYWINELNYKVNCALWTKNVDYLVKAFTTFDDLTKQEIRNVLNVLVSSTFVGISIGDGFIRKTENALGMPIGVFTVETTENEKTNCGARDCNKCGRCYKKFTDTTRVFEVLK
jgi:hypothetical protein